jgi:hypothetical protein
MPSPSKAIADLEQAFECAKKADRTAVIVIKVHVAPVDAGRRLVGCRRAAGERKGGGQRRRRRPGGRPQEAAGRRLILALAGLGGAGLKETCRSVAANITKI